MRLIVQPNYDLLSEWAANYVAKRINEFAPKEGTPFVLGLPTGSSPLGMYRNLIRLYQEGKVSFRNVVTFNMDEYVGIPEDHPESYHSFMWKNFFSHIDIRPENVNILNGTEREKEVLAGVLAGKKRKEIAEALFISESTVKKHIASIYTKLHVSSRSELLSLLYYTK